MELNLIHFYPDLMSLYGSYANLSLLARTLEKMGNTVVITYVSASSIAISPVNSHSPLRTSAATARM